MANLSQHHVKGLQIRLPTLPQSELPKNEALRALLLTKTLPPVEDVLLLLSDSAKSIQSDQEHDALVYAITARLAINVYADALDTLLREASEAETEAEWWANVERSRANVAWYLLQTLPKRIYDAALAVLHVARTQNVTVTSLLSSQSFRLRNLLATSLFPHLDRQHTMSALSFKSPSALLAAARASSPPDIPGIITSFFTRVSKAIRAAYKLLTLPFELVQQECYYKRRHLQRIRNERAYTLGYLAQQRSELEYVISNSESTQELANFLLIVMESVSGNQSRAEGLPPSSLLNELVKSLPIHKHGHASMLRSSSLLRPSVLIRAWPKVILLPPLLFFASRTIYNQRDSLQGILQEVKETIEGFMNGWVIDPVNDILKTVRAGGEGDEGIIVRKEGVKADLDSLERMAVSLAEDKLGYTPVQVEVLKSKISVGDLTPVLEIYERDIRNPIKSALFGTLVRSLFVQVQKTKVDVDQALTGIDKLIKSQELTFAFVGVAPALAVVYVFGGYLGRFFTGSVLRLTGSRGDARYGGRRKREVVWLLMRRIERLLMSQRSEGSLGSTPIPPLTHGLLLLSLSQLREYAYSHLPARSGFLRDKDYNGPVDTFKHDETKNANARTSPNDGMAIAIEEMDLFNDNGPDLREGFLEDIASLENPSLSKEEKLKVLERMWRCWGSALGWHSLGE
ncbi:NCA2-domain-containing protein [Pleurotus eryngii]|uniref:NCA2-domain-containing protein n=1 Tax=Pleurotus eryngii TaxID=5323 RepID=A0A9P6A4R8_PLEER|nr:NCA2-domain-containing protein [Pleurotus eryngii]